MDTRSQQTHGRPSPLVADMVSRWRPGRSPRNEAIRLAAEACHHSALPLAEVRDLCVAARPAEAGLWQDIFVHNLPQLGASRKLHPAPRLEAPDLQHSCARIASCVRVNELLAAHELHLSFFRRSFGLDRVPAAQQHLVSLAAPAEGVLLANYLGIPQDQLLCLKTGGSVRRQVSHGSILKADSSLLRRMRSKVADYAGLEAMEGGSVTILGHYTYDKEEGRPQCGFLRANELLNLFPGGLRPRVLNLFFCGSESFANECAELLKAHRVTINYVEEDMQVNLHQLAPEGFGQPHPAARYASETTRQPTLFYYGGPDVAVDGAIGKLFGPKQQDAWRLFRVIEVGEEAP